MQRYLITGISGFVASHFLAFLEKQGESCEVLGLDVLPCAARKYSFPCRTEVLDLLDGRAIERCILEFQPTRILHLASVSNVGVSWKDPVGSFSNNTNIFLNLLDPLRKHEITTKVLSVGSSEEYGVVHARDLPLIETRALNPGSPYGVARVAQEQLSKVFAEGYSLDIVMTRSFNHIGPGQRDQFVVPSFVKQVVQAKRAGEARCIIRAGNTKVVRDFLDVRDVVRAYYSLFVQGRRGEVYNICSGTGRSLDQILAILSELLEIEVSVELDQALLRPNELMEIVGSAAKLKDELSWRPQFDFRTSLKDMVSYWDNKITEQELSARE